MARRQYNLFITLVALLIASSITGCSVAMALHGKQEPNFEAFEEGSSRKQVEIQLGTPAFEKVLDDGKKEDTYQYEIGNSPNGARATLYFYYDLATIGLAEPIFSLIELFQGHKEESRIIYDAQERVVSIQGYKPPRPSAELKAAMDEQDKYKKTPVTSHEIKRPKENSESTQATSQ
jgi:hypothetical protein